MAKLTLEGTEKQIKQLERELKNRARRDNVTLKYSGTKKQMKKVVTKEKDPE